MARPTTRAKVHAAALALACEGPVGSMTMQGLAARAGVGKQTVYRTWSSTGAVLVEALLARSTDADGTVAVPDTGDLAADLTILGDGMVAELTDPAHEPVLRALTAQAQADEALATTFRERLLEVQLQAIAERLRRGGVRDAADVAELFVGPVLHRWLLRTRPFTTAWMRAHVARTLRAAGR